VLAGCDAPTVDGVTVPAGFEVEELVTGLVGPTQAVVGGDGRLVVAQLAGGEREGTGQVVRLDPDDPADRDVLADGLLVPTGIAVVGDQLWIMEQRTLTRRPIGGGPVDVVAGDLPYNGRSNGTLTVLDDGRILFDTSGSIRGGEVVEGSGRLWTVTDDGPPEVLASGFKHAYAHVVDRDGVLWTTEIGDGRYDGERPPDELLAVSPGLDHGWPRCIGDNLPVAEFGGTEAGCRDVPRSHAVFEAGATPTSVAVAPWDPDTLLVALWNLGLVVTVPRAAADGPVEAVPFIEGIDHPQHLVADGDRLLVVDHGGGRIIAVSER
jgi:glucose/arabinose dehydrogenase